MLNHDDDTEDKTAAIPYMTMRELCEQFRKNPQPMTDDDYYDDYRDRTRGVL